MRKHPERYVAAVLPELRFEDEQFCLPSFCLGIVIDSTMSFHKNTVHELLRVASEEVRIFPLTDLTGTRYDLLDRLILELEAEGLRVTEAKVPYEFMRNGNSLLSIRKM
ncbi:hypothetical protein [Paenibacillus polymyxa]|uniref:hypothetical protein n=1 Tax=Paenibacillus polymyxa TaxID=1406 RepID=UPI0001E6C103|nr:hypothetical protein [Paenibacillus polymyxa]WPQ56761.1 hypothetical protein SKN87_25010 [Paenibacillus polymyxa]